jgi:hypothetical protein
VEAEPPMKQDKYPSKEFFQTLMEVARHPIPFPVVIERSTGHKVLPLTEEDKEVIEEIYEAAKKVTEECKNKNWGKDTRVNEIHNELTKRLREKLNGKRPEGKEAGYPDIEIERRGKPYYIEVKLAGKKQLTSKFRSFYYEPVELTKVTKDAPHILVGWGHEGKKIRGFKIVDLHKIKVRLKPEFNTNNPEIYKPENVVKEFLL